MSDKINKTLVVEKMIRIEAYVNIRIWVDITDLFLSNTGNSDIQQRSNKVRGLFVLFIQGTNNCSEATKAIANGLKMSSVSDYVNAFEVTDANGDGIVYYCDWP